MALLAFLLLVPGVARADDWLAVLPECAGEQVLPGVAQLLYPRAGLPALVAAGESLVVRARLALPLTPPPGVQQERALEGFEAELIGHALPLAGAENIAQRYPLALVDVRPEGPSSLRYRLAFPLPAWVAPGSYDLVLRAKGASLRADSAVRVLAVGAAPRLAWTRVPVPADNAAALLAPIDVWVRAPDAVRAGAAAAIGRNASPTIVRDGLRAAAAPVLETTGLVAALRVGDGLWVMGSCDAPYLPFDVEVGSVLSAERRSRVTLAPALGAQASQPIAGAGRAWPEPSAALLEQLAALRAAKPAGASTTPLVFGVHDALELSLLMAPGSAALHAEGGVLNFYPLGELGPAQPPVIARWSLLAGDHARLTRSQPVALHARMLLAPDPVRGDAPVHAQVSAGRALSAVALRFDHRSTAFGLAPAEHRYRALGAHRVQGAALANDGALSLLDAEVTVATARMSSGGSCVAAAPSARAAVRTRPVSAGLGLWAAALLLKRRRRPRAGNRLAPHPRSAGLELPRQVADERRDREEHLSAVASRGCARLDRGVPRGDGLHDQHDSEYARARHQREP